MPKIVELIFIFDEVTLVIHPESLVEPITTKSGTEHCRIMLQPIPDAENKLILGTTFMKSIYVGLDYYTNIISFGSRVGPYSSEITPHTL